MSDEHDDATHDPATKAAADDVLALMEEVEASGDATLGGAGLENMRAQLHAWVDSVVGVVTAPAFGRVTLIHKNGRRSTITSPELPFALGAPVDWKK